MINRIKNIGCPISDHQIIATEVKIQAIPIVPTLVNCRNLSIKNLLI